MYILPFKRFKALQMFILVLLLPLLRCVAVWCSVVQCVAVCCSVLQMFILVLLLPLLQKEPCNSKHCIHPHIEGILCILYTETQTFEERQRVTD